MDFEELKALIEKATENFNAQKAENDKTVNQLKALGDQYATLKSDFDKLKEGGDADGMQKMADAIEELQGEMEGVATKLKNPVNAITDEQQIKALRTVAETSLGGLIKSTKDGGQTIDILGRMKKKFTDECKTLNISSPETGGLAIAEVLSRDVAQYQREFSPIANEVMFRPSLTRDFREMVIIGYPDDQEGIENVAGVVIPETGNQTYAETKSKVFKINMKPRITDEAMMSPDVDIYSQLVQLLGRQNAISLARNILFGGGNPSLLVGRGILASRIDITNGTGESFKPTLDPVPANMRGPDFYPVKPTGVDGALGSSDKAIVDLLIDLTTSDLPSFYLKNAKLYFNRKTLALMKKIRNGIEDPVFKQSFMDSNTSILGFPFVIDDTMPDIASNSTPIIFGDLKAAYQYNTGDISKFLVDPYTVDGCTVLKIDQEYFEKMGVSDAIIVVACTTNGPA